MSALVKPDSGLLALAEARRYLAEARDALGVLDLRNRALAVEHYLRQRDDAGTAALDAAELRLRAERRLGELLAETVNHQGSRGVGSAVKPTLPPEISKLQSHRYQLAATVPEPRFKALLEEARQKADVRLATTAAVLRLARQEKLQQQPGAGGPVPGAEEFASGGKPWACKACEWENEADAEQCAACGVRQGARVKRVECPACLGKGWVPDRG